MDVYRVKNVLKRETDTHRWELKDADRWQNSKGVSRRVYELDTR